MEEFVDHIGIATAAPDSLAAVYTAAFDLAVTDREHLPGQGVDVVWLRGNAGAAIELLAPLSSESAVGKFLATRGMGMHHLALRVPDILQALERCRTAGLQLIDETPRQGSGGTLVAFVHPKSAGGVLIELVQQVDDPAVVRDARIGL